MAHPIIKALRHHKTAVVLITLEIALTLAIIANALLIIGTHVSQMQVASGLPDSELVWLKTTGIDDEMPATERASRTEAAMAALRAQPDVRGAAMVNGLPLSKIGSWTMCLYRRPEKDNKVCQVDMYAGTPGYLDVLGVRIAKGRPFTANDVTDYNFGGHNQRNPPPVIVSRSLADQLWPGEDPLGKPVYLDVEGLQVSHVVGVSEHIANAGLQPGEPADLNILVPVRSLPVGNFVVRTVPGAADKVAASLPAVLARVDSNRVVTGSGTLEDNVREYFRNDRALILLLASVIGSLLLLTGLGVFGLTGFWVQERVRYIGIRRALGATEADIRHYFQLENLAIVSFGVALGAVTAVCLNFWLLVRYELPRLPLLPLLGGALLLFAIGQLAVLQPARRACRVPPVAATRAA
jgi:putative ABC transport system permease protein